MTLHRTEVEVAADAVWSLIAGGLLPRSAEVIVAAARLAHVPVSALRAASERQERGLVAPPRTAEVDVVQSAPPPTVATRSNGHRAVARPDPESLPPQPTDRWCKGPCRNRRPAQHFYRNEDVCRRCRNLRRRELRIARSHAMNAVRLTFVVSEADEALAKLVCMECGLPLRVGDEVQTGASLMHHVNCPRDGLVRHAARPVESVSTGLPKTEAVG